MATGPQAEVGASRILPLGNVYLDLNTFEVWLDDDLISVTYLEFELLRLLASSLDRILPLDDLTQGLWHESGHIYVRRLNVMVCRVRSKLEHSTPYRLITVRGRGYGLIARPNHKTRRRATARV